MTVTETEKGVRASERSADVAAAAIGGSQEDEQGLAITPLSFERGIEAPSWATLLSEGSRSPDTYQYARVELKVKNNGSAGTQVWGFSLVDRDGRRYGEANSTLFEPNAMGETVGPDEQLRGFVPFVIPKRAKITTLHYVAPGGVETLNWQL